MYQINGKNCVLYTKILLFGLFLTLSCVRTQEDQIFDIIVIGGGTGGTSAGIQAARLGAHTVIIEPTPWLGGMLTAAGVSATDGNHQLPSGIWGEFRDSLYAHYGGPEALATGWVSNTQFEPSVGARIFANMASKERQLEVHLNTTFSTVKKLDDYFLVEAKRGDSLFQIKSKLIIDGTDMGDVAAMLGVNYDLGMDARAKSGEAMAPEQANDLIQDLTYAAILKDYGEGSDKTIPKPANYDPSLFYCACQKLCEDPDEKPHPCETMLTYAKLPNEKYMINWPIFGNDYYSPIVDMSADERQAEIQKAKEKTFQFIYYIQQELGYKNLGLAEDEYATADLLPFLPYYREGRRIHGLVRVNVNHLVDPYTYNTPLYKAGIAVGDYPIDHHHKEVPDAPEIDFPPVPSFNLPLGALIPKDVDGLIMADKAISVSNIVNGSSRLQPVVLQIGQAAGVLAALSAQQGKSPGEVDVREVQEALLAQQGYLMPYYDVKPDHPQFAAIQKIGASGLLKGTGEPYLWANRTWFYPDSTLTVGELKAGIARAGLEATDIAVEEEEWINSSLLSQLLPAVKVEETNGTNLLSRAAIAALLDEYLDPFAKPIEQDGSFK